MACQCEKKIDKLDADIQQIKRMLEQMTDSHSHIQTSCKRMDDHIGFIDNVYGKMRQPLTWIVNRIGYSETLPSISTSIEGKDQTKET